MVGRGDLVTLTQADEQEQHPIPTTELLNGLYINELILRLTPQLTPQLKLFQAYQQTLHRLTNRETNPQAVMRFELYFLEILGYKFNLYHDDISTEKIEASYFYRYIPEQGMIKTEPNIQQENGFIISGVLLIALRDLQSMQFENWQELRTFLDRLMTYLVGKPINSRRFIS